MELILLIVKIILTFFGVLLSLLILVSGLLLFVPVRYEVSGSIEEPSEVQFHGSLSYFMSAVRIRVSYEKGQFTSKFFLFGAEKKARKENAEEVAAEAEETLETEAEETAEAEIEAAKTKAEKTAETEVETAKTKAKETAKAEIKTAKIKAEEAETGKRVKKRNDKSRTEKRRIIKQWLTAECYQSVLRKILSELRYLWKHFKFRKIAADVTFAAEDPAVTGQVLGVLCMLPVLYRYQLQVTPDFEAEHSYVKGAFQASGKVRLIHLTITFLRLLFDKEVRFVFKQLADDKNGDKRDSSVDEQRG